MARWRCDKCNSTSIRCRFWVDNDKVAHNQWECRDCGEYCTPVKEEKEENNG